MSDNPITVGGAYVEDENHVPNPTDMVAQFNTEGVGAHGKIDEVSPIFEVDKVKTAQEILGALDPDNTEVSSDRVLLPNLVDDNDVAREDLLARAEARVKQGVVVGEATPAQREAEKDGSEGERAAVESERQNAASNSTGTRDAGVHTDAAGAPTATGTTQSEASAAQGETAKQETDGNKAAAADDKATTGKATTGTAAAKGKQS